MGEGDFSDHVTAHFEIVCPESRGVGPCSTVRCDPDLRNQTPSYFIKNETSFWEVVNLGKTLG